MRSDIYEINGFTAAQTAKWSDKEVVEYYEFSMKNSLFNDSMTNKETGKPIFPKLFKPAGQRKTDQMKQLLKLARTLYLTGYRSSEVMKLKHDSGAVTAKHYTKAGA